MRASHINSLKKNLLEIQKLKESALANTGCRVDQSVITELNNKEKDLFLQLENFQPNLNMFGSNVFTSIDTVPGVDKSQNFTRLSKDSAQYPFQNGKIDLKSEDNSIEIGT